MTTAVPIILAAGEGDRQAFLGGGLHTWKLLAEQTNGAMFLFEDTMAGGKMTPLHRHPEADEISYVLEGEIILKVDGTDHRIGAGGMSFVPRGVPHAFVVVSDTARMLAMQNPGIGQSFYRGASDPSTDDNCDAVDIPRLQASAKDNPRGIELLGPPPFEAATAR